MGQFPACCTARVAQAPLPMTLYLRSRKVLLAFAIVAVLALTSASVGLTNIRLPAEGEPLQLPLLVFLDAFASAAAVNSLSNPAPDADAADVGVINRSWWWHLAGALLVTVILMSLAGFARSGEGGAWMELRSCLGWLGLALLSGGLVRSDLSWLGPLLGLLAVSWFGFHDGDVASWNWGFAAVSSTHSWLCASGLLAGGLLTRGLRQHRDSGLKH